MSIERGPYVSEDLGTWWFPVDAWGWDEAQHEAALFASDSDSKAVYDGKREVSCHEHDFTEEDTCCKRMAYTFLMEER